MVPRTLICTYAFTIMLQWIYADTTAVDITAQLILDFYQVIIAILEDFLRPNEEMLQILRKYTRLYQQEQKKMEENQKYIGNPVNMFKTFKRLSTELRFLDSIISQGDKLKRIQSRQFMGYTELNCKRIADDLLRRNFDFPISVNDCFEIGRLLYSVSNSKSALRWLFQTIRQYETADDVTVNKTKIIKFVRNAPSLVDELKDELPWPKMLLHLKFEERKKEPSFEKKTHTSYQFGVLCRGEIKLTAAKTKRLRCYYTNGPAPYFRLAPVKTEQVFKGPNILLYYDVISDDEISTIKEIGEVKFQRSKKPYHTSANTSRVNKNMWLDGRDVPAVARISKRLSLLTGFRLHNTEELEVTSYGVGGYLTTHYDGMTPNGTEEKERIWDQYEKKIATVLLYLSDVEQGGATVFLHGGLTVYPVKNAGLFWKNHLSSGNLDPRTFHGTCPVLRGSKLVANKWFKSHGQELVKPCRLKGDPDFPRESYYYN